MKRNSLKLIICPQCGSDKFAITVFKENHLEIEDGYITCEKCNSWHRIESGIVDLLPKSLKRLDLYKKFIDKYNMKLSVEISLNKDDRQKNSQIDFFRKNLSDYENNVVNSRYYRALDIVTLSNWTKTYAKEGDIALDIGCGTGRQCLLLAQRKIKTIGIDISEEMLLEAKNKISRQNLNGYVDLLVADATNPPLRNNSFDLCILYGILHHLEDRNGTIIKVSQKLKKTGRFFSLDPNKSPMRFIFDFLMKYWKLYKGEADDLPLISKKELSQWLTDAGIKNKIAYSTYILPHFLYPLSVNINIKLLRFTDRIFNKVPLIRNFGGAIITEGIKV